MPRRHAAQSGERAAVRAVAVCALLIAIGGVTHAAEIGGYAVEVEGAWRIERPPPGAALRRWADVPAGATLRNANPQAGDRLRVVDRRSALVVDRVGAAAADCADPITLPAAANAPAGTFGRMLEAALQKLKSEPERLSSHISRSDAGAERLTDAVVSIDAGGIDLTGALAALPAGQYRLRLEPVMREASQGAAAVPFVVDRDPARASIAALAPPMPGLYELGFVRAAGARARTGGASAWVVVAPRPRHAEIEGLYREAARALPAAIDPETRQVVLRTLMEELAAELAR